MNWCQYILFRLFLFSCSDVQENTDISLTRINMSIKKSADNGKHGRQDMIVHSGASLF